MVSEAVKFTNPLLQKPAHPPQRILVADDNGDIRQLSTEVLVRSGYVADAVADGAAAWRALNATRYDLLITGHEMPKMTGVDLLKKLHSVRMKVPVILASATWPREEFARSPWIQPVAALLMPYTVAEFLGKVREVLHASRLRDRQTGKASQRQLISSSESAT